MSSATGQKPSEFINRRNQLIGIDLLFSFFSPSICSFPHVYPEDLLPLDQLPRHIEKDGIARILRRSATTASRWLREFREDPCFKNRVMKRGTANGAN
jgi:hypothetical protein